MTNYDVKKINLESAISCEQKADKALSKHPKDFETALYEYETAINIFYRMDDLANQQRIGKKIEAGKINEYKWAKHITEDPEAYQTRQHNQAIQTFEKLGCYERAKDFRDYLKRNRLA